MAGTTDHQRVFLTAEWRDLVMLNYEVAPASLRDFVPRGTELDAFGGKTLVSLVGFGFYARGFSGGGNSLPLEFRRGQSAILRAAAG